MRNYIRTCLSLNQKTRDKITDIAKIMETSKSEAVKTAIIHFYYEIATMKAKEKQ